VGDLNDEIRLVADRVAHAYLRQSKPRAILLVGSGATGGADRFSDLDLLLYYEAVPAEEVLAAARQELNAEDFKGTLWPEEGYSERYDVGGFQCQLGHAVIVAWEREIARVVDDLELDWRLLKQLCGLFEGRPLHGAELIGQWREQAAYTERLQRAMIEKHWTFFPWWYYQEKLALRDATIWRYDVLVQSAYNIAGTLAALNRIYFSTFELKRLARFASLLRIAPPNLEQRLNALFEFDAEASTAELERLVADTQALVAQRFPDVDLSMGDKPTPPGSRESP
jgi:predicted nucleotidyltransferase